jgi:hypothetical protein
MNSGGHSRFFTIDELILEDERKPSSEGPGPAPNRTYAIPPGFPVVLDTCLSTYDHINLLQGLKYGSIVSSSQHPYYLPYQYYQTSLSYYLTTIFGSTRETRPRPFTYKGNLILISGNLDTPQQA